MGLSKIKQAMWRADPLHGEEFSDLTDTNQIVLFTVSPDLTLLKRLLQRHFQGSGWIGIQQVEQFLLKDTPFSEAIHLKRLTLKPVELEDDIEVRRPFGSRNRPGDYPAGTRIKFV